MGLGGVEKLVGGVGGFGDDEGRLSLIMATGDASLIANVVLCSLMTKGAKSCFFSIGDRSFTITRGDLSLLVLTERVLLVFELMFGVRPTAAAEKFVEATEGDTSLKMGIVLSVVGEELGAF